MVLVSAFDLLGSKLTFFSLPIVKFTCGTNLLASVTNVVLYL
jgi:hypothetical protein